MKKSSLNHDGCFQFKKKKKQKKTHFLMVRGIYISWLSLYSYIKTAIQSLNTFQKDTHMTLQVISQTSANQFISFFLFSQTVQR